MRTAFIWTFVLVCLVAIVAAADPSFAQISLPKGGPAPLIGMGLPLVGLVVGAVWLVRHLRKD